ncbi:hypothetical protein L0152_18430, partial [bacterium]|nr:hypothetical protein [bacterium]
MKAQFCIATVLSILISVAAFADGIHTDPDVDRIIAEASELYLNAKFDEGIQLLQQLEKTNPNNPAVSFFIANGYWWKIFRVYVYDRDAEGTPFDDSFDRYLNLTIQRSEALLDRNSKDIRGLFYLGNAN